MEIHKTKIYVLAFVLCLILAGCKSTESVLKEYQKVLFTDGINVNEAQLIAQKRIMGSAYTQSFDSLNPLVLMNEHTDKYKNFWFIVFPSQDSSSPYNYMIVVDKVSGGIIRARNYQPASQKDFSWLFK